MNIKTYERATQTYEQHPNIQHENVWREQNKNSFYLWFGYCEGDTQLKRAKCQIEYDMMLASKIDHLKLNTQHNITHLISCYLLA